MSVDYFQILTLALPEMVVVLTALAVLGLDLLFLREDSVADRLRLGAGFTTFGCVLAAFFMLGLAEGPRVALAGGMFVADGLSRLVKLALLGLTVFTAWISVPARFTDHVGEYFALLLLATTGMMFLVSSENLLMIFVSLELVSLSLYILTAFNKQNRKSAEAALKYFLFGGMAAAFTLFGLSLVYGLSGSIQLPEIAAKLKGQGMDPLLAVALVMTVIGFGFKIAAVPFHLWAPDAYQGAPTPCAAFIASGSKLASFVVFAKVMMMGFAGAEGSGAWRHFVSGWVPVLAVIAALSMLLGNLAALAQSNLKRLLAYSAIAHAGYALFGIMADTAQGVSALVYYLITYGLTTVGAFGVAGLVEAATGDTRLSDFAGLSRRSPFLSLCMMVFILSLVGIPPLAGFFGKFYVFTAALSADPKHLGLLWLVIFAVAMSAVSLYYYLRVLKQIYVAEEPPGAPAVPAPLSSQIALALLALAVLVLGAAPNLLLAPLEAALKLTQF